MKSHLQAVAVIHLVLGIIVGIPLTGLSLVGVLWAVIGLAWLGGDLEKSGLSVASLGTFGISTLSVIVFFGALVLLALAALSGLATGFGFWRSRRWAARVSLFTGGAQLIAAIPLLLFGVVLGSGSFLLPPCLLSFGGAAYTMWALFQPETRAHLH